MGIMDGIVVITAMICVTLIVISIIASKDNK